jgi:uncharacterized protein YaiL (DUF2058 family)
MGTSLQDQLLKAGLTDKAKAKQAKKERHKKVKNAQKHKVDMVSQSALDAEKKRIEKQAKDRQLNEQQQSKVEQKAIAAQVKQLIEINKQDKGKDEQACNFTDGKVIKVIRVSHLVQKHISEGKLAIVRFVGGYELVPVPVADKISQRDPDTVVYRADRLDQSLSDDQSSEEDDWYADYQIPDDLTW